MAAERAGVFDLAAQYPSADGWPPQPDTSELRIPKIPQDGRDLRWTYMAWMIPAEAGEGNWATLKSMRDLAQEWDRWLASSRLREERPCRADWRLPHDAHRPDASENPAYSAQDAPRPSSRRGPTDLPQVPSEGVEWLGRERGLGAAAADPRDRSHSRGVPRGRSQSRPRGRSQSRMPAAAAAHSRGRAAAPAAAAPSRAPAAAAANTRSPQGPMQHVHHGPPAAQPPRYFDARLRQGGGGGLAVQHVRLRGSAAAAAAQPPQNWERTLQESGVLARAAPIGASAPFRGWEHGDLRDSQPAPWGLQDGRGRHLYRAGEPAFLGAAAMHVGFAFQELATGYRNLAVQEQDGRPLITLCSRGNRYWTEPNLRHNRRPYLRVDRWFDCTFACDPDQQRRHSGPGQYAARGCTGQCGPIQHGISVYAAFRSLVADVRGRLAQDLIGPMLRGPDARPVPVTYAYVCTTGRHRSVAVAELLAHCLHACGGVADVQVVHEDVACSPHNGHFGSCGCPDPAMCRVLRGMGDAERAHYRQHYNTGLQAARANARMSWETWGAW